eukprot:scaffold11570_cov17-Tisochrysis_lutea.AAC.1
MEAHGGSPHVESASNPAPEQEGAALVADGNALTDQVKSLQQGVEKEVEQPAESQSHAQASAPAEEAAAEPLASTAQPPPEEAAAAAQLPSTIPPPKDPATAAPAPSSQTPATQPPLPEPITSRTAQAEAPAEAMPRGPAPLSKPDASSEVAGSDMSVNKAKMRATHDCLDSGTFRLNVELVSCPAMMYVPGKQLSAVTLTAAKQLVGVRWTSALADLSSASLLACCRGKGPSLCKGHTAPLQGWPLSLEMLPCTSAVS